MSTRATTPATTPTTPSRGAGRRANRKESLRRTGDWARRAPLLPALLLVILVTQLPFVVTIVVSFMNWNAYYPDQRGFTGLSNFGTVLGDPDARRAIFTTILLTAAVVLI